MGNEQSSPHPPELAATTLGNVWNIGNLYGSNIIGARDVSLTNNYNFMETTSGNIGKYKEWLDTPDPSVNHNSALYKHHPDTGNWLLGHSLYENWKTSSNSFLWLHGLPGSGKTILCSMIIEHVQGITEEGSIGLAYYYFDISDIKKRTVEGLLSSLVLGLYICNPTNHSALDQLYKNCRDGIRKPSGQQLEDVLKQLLSGFNETYIVIDALDECKEHQELLKLLKLIKRIHGWQIGQSHLFITSRKERAIVNSLQHVALKEMDLTVMPVGDDINKYIDERLEESEELNTLELAKKQQIKNLLKAKADGMFRWVACQIDALENCCHSKARLEQALKMLPKDLETTYDQILERIHATNEKHAVTLLYWLVFAIEPLKIEELAIVVQINVEKNCLDPEEGLEAPKDILKICSSLVTMSSDGKLKLAHASVKEYFLDKPRKIGKKIIDPGDGDLVMSKLCLAYLHHPRKREKYLHWENWTGTLARYCGTLWHRHVLAYKNETAVKDQILMACDTESIAHKNWISWRSWWNSSQYMYEPVTPLEHAAVSGLLETVGWLLTETSIGDSFGSALQAASYEGCKNIVKLLLDKGADVNAQGGLFGNALQAASYKGNKDIVELLLDKGADVNGEFGKFGNVLQAASWSGNKDIVELLLDKGADVNAQGGHYGNALQAASYGGDKDIVELLFDKGADLDAQGGPYGNALQAASVGGKKDIVELLIGKTADVNVQGGEYGNALQAASCWCYKSIVELLLDKGAEVNAQGGPYGNALQAASMGGDKDIVELLIDRGAIVNVQSGRYGNALQAASAGGKKDIVELLLDKGADVNAQGGPCGNAIQAALEHGYRDVVELLKNFQTDGSRVA